MNYFIFRITERPIRQLEKLEQHDTYRSASARVRQLRSELPADSNTTVRMIHAETELHAEWEGHLVRRAEGEPDLLYMARQRPHSVSKTVPSGRLPPG